MHTIGGALYLAAVIGLWLYYRPKTETGRMILAVGGAVGVMTLLLPAVTWFLQMITIITRIVVLLCCAILLFWEKRQQKATTKIKAMPKHPGSNGRPPKGGKESRATPPAA